jgi:cell division protein ZapC
MSAFTPSSCWHWQVDAGKLQLHSSSVLHNTPFMVNDLTAIPAAEFTLAQAELFWQFRHALEPLNLPEAICFAAAIDAMAAQLFLRQTGHKSWWFTPVSNLYLPQATELVWIGAAEPLLAIITAQHGTCCQLLLLQQGYTLQGKPLYAGQVLVLLNDRVQPFTTPSCHQLAKSA